MAEWSSSFSLKLPFLFLLPYFLLCNGCCSIKDNNHGHEIQGMFVFGSSLVDNGNNNLLQNSSAKANYWPYGIDFPLGPTGRYTNGKNIVDLLCDKLVLPFIPTFSDPSTKGRRIVRGVDFASGGSGILDSTGSLAVKKIKFFWSLTLSLLLLLFFL